MLHSNANGFLVISLDFELHWGVFDAMSFESYKENLLKVWDIIPELIEMSDRYNVKLSFAPVGFLLAKNKSELLGVCPTEKPTYINGKFNPYRLFDSLGESEKDDPFHYALPLINTIKKHPNHEILTHTFSHYYCNEVGQNPKQFEADLIAGIEISKQNGIAIKSIIFPRNQINKKYLEICKKHGIICYRGPEKHWMHQTQSTEDLEKSSKKLLRLIDSYFNLSGNNTYPLDSLQNGSCIMNIPSSRFLRPFSSQLKLFNSLKLNRITKAMTYAAKKNELYHLWFHPHNFGCHTKENFDSLKTIFEHYKMLNEKYGFQSETMGGLSKKMLNTNHFL
ncbi:polysaccharide deacetylase family protein [Mangrovimonas aestuarii]|uniref:polysaccharide deacetylase family protein n=1 Tax=Mangrovimonas aestuarii TaxID=3018443 RepID=UPI002378ACD7|nr:polysaccharide deacetylase family protein [Mangrovimonas aestuarii]